MAVVVVVEGVGDVITDLALAVEVEEEDLEVEAVEEEVWSSAALSWRLLAP